MAVRSLKLLSDGYFELDMGMLVYAKASYYGVKYMAALKPLLIQTDSENILVDTGIGELPGIYKPFYKVDREITLEQSLKGVGMSPEDISMVINTHLHVDHCGNNRLFKNAKVVVQEEELRYSKNPHRFQKGGYIEEMFSGMDIQTVTGNQEIVSGVSVILTSGHTPGHQAVVIDATDSELGKRYVYCGDEVPLEENLRKRNITGILYNQVKSLEAIDTIRSIDAVYIYSHDREQLEIN